MLMKSMKLVLSFVFLFAYLTSVSGRAIQDDVKPEG